jgi:hypothetical protein
MTIAARACGACNGTGDWINPRTGKVETCPTCGGSGISPLGASVPDAIREHWGFSLGLDGHDKGLTRDDSPFYRHSSADQAWRLGWARAERAAVRAVIREKIAAEMSFWTQEEMRNAA